MAYALRYYKELIHEDGSTHRLEIHKKDSTAEAVEIGAVIQGLALEIQGSQGDVDSPIVKTSLSMTFVDAGDIEDGRKNGFWQEFYTPDALLWKVILKARTATETSFRTIWGGYVTPDSFSESLVYRGSVNIIARDNLGHMQDFPFDAVGDADGLISLRNLVEAGWEKIQSPMVLDWRGETESNMWLMCDGVPAPDTLMNVSQFEGMDWYKAIETALASYGIVMRWVGDNIVNVSSLRSMPLQGREVMDNLSQITPVFVAGAQRELVPAVRRIEESVDYDLVQDYQPRIDIQDFSGNTFDVETSWGVVSGIAWSLIESSPMSSFGWYNEVPFKTLAFNPAGYDIDENISESERENIRKATCLLTGSKNDDTHSLSYAMLVNPEDYTIGISFGRFLSRLTHGDGHYFLGYPINEPTDAYRVRYAVKTIYDGVDYYLTSYGEWTDSFVTQTQEVQGDKMSVEVPLSGIFTGVVQVSLIFLNIDTGEEAVRIKQILGFSLSNRSNKAYLEKNTVNTVYNAENNVILSRTPEIGPAYDAVALPGFIKNGIFYRSGGVILPARKWGWSGSTPQQMAVYNHLQLLCYYAKPNNLISGTIVNGDLTSGRAIYLWHGKEHLLVSGRYNLLNGMIEGAMLREFTRYEAMWGEVSETAFPDTEQDSTTNVEGGASSGGSSSTYTNTTTVNIGSGGGGGASYLNDLLDVNTDSVTTQSVLYYNGTEWVGRSLSAILNGYAKSADLLTLSNLLASMWSIDADGNLVTDKQVIIKNNLIVKGDTSSGGSSSGETVIGTTSIVVDGVSYPSKDGVIDLSKAFEGLQVEIDLSNYATKGYVTTAISNLNIDQYATEDELSEVSGRVEKIENAGYATTKEVESAITNLNISQYLKSATAESTYAKIASLTAVDNRLKGIEAYFATSEDADTQINKWNEIVAFLNATEGTTLAGILAAYTLQSDFDTLSSDVGNISNTVKGHTSSIGNNASAIGVLQGYFTNGVAKKATADASGNVITSYYTPISTHNAFKESTNASLASKADKATTLAGYGIEDAYTTTQIDAKVQTINSSITALDTKYAPVKTWYDALGSLIVKDGNNVRIKTNLIVEGDTASGGTGGGAAIGVTGILVDGKQYTDNDSDGYIDLSEAFAGLSPTITSAMITEALGYVPANSASLGSLASKDSIAWSEITDVLTGGDEFNIIPSGHNGVFSFNYRAKDGGSGTITEYRMRNGGGSYAPVRALSFIAHGGTSSQFLKADGSFDSTSYLSTAGGTIEGGFGALSIKRNNAYASAIRFENTSGILGYIGINYDYNVRVWNKNGDDVGILIHSGNYSDYALPLTGGILDGSLQIGKNDNTAYNSLLIVHNGKQVELTATNSTGVLFYNGVGFVFNETTASWNDNTLLHSGNVGEYALNIDGSNARATKLTSSESLDSYKYGFYSYTNGNNPTNSFGDNTALFAFTSNRGNDTWQIAFDGNGIQQNAGPRFGIRGNYAGQGWTSWYQIATTSSNVASAQALKHSNGTVGATVGADGKLCISTQGIFNSDASLSLFDFNGTNLNVGYSMRNSYITDIYGNTIRFLVGTATKMLINSSGNVTIGSSDFAGTSAKLWVDGKTYTEMGFLFHGSYGIWKGSRFTASMDDTGILYNATRHVFLNGNVLIGTTEDIGYKFEVIGKTHLQAYKGQDEDTYVNIGPNAFGIRVQSRGDGNTYFQSQRFDSTGVYYNIVLQELGGNVGIGTTDPQYKLDVAGQGRFTGAVTFNGSVYLKGGVEVYGTIPYIDFHFGNATNDYTSRISEIESGNLAVYANWLPNTNNAKRLGNSDRRWSEIFGVNGNLSGTLNVGGASTFNGDVRINGNLVVTGDTASGGTGESNVGGNLRLDYDAIWALINKTSITQAEMDAVGVTTEVVDNLTVGAYNKIVVEKGAYKYVYNYECRDLDGSIQLHIYFGDDNIDNCERFYFERSDAGTWTLNFYEV